MYQMNYLAKTYIKNMSTPKFTHDCQKCVFLGNYKWRKEDYDLYFCATEPTVIARYGNEGPEYKSGLIFGKLAIADNDMENPLGVALRLAIKKGLYTEKIK